jgi:hypothetical protein
MEMELLYSRAIDMNGSGDHSDDDSGEASIYKPKYERAMKELELTRRRLQQQHEDDMEQVAAVKKQLEKKVRLRIVDTKKVSLLSGGVTRSGEFSPLGRLFNLVSFLT